MLKRRLGRTGMMVSEIAFGGVEIGIPYGIGVQSHKDMLTDEQAIILLRNAFKAGINFYDTARMYGKSEELIGMAFKECRDEVIIATKVAHFLRKDGTLPKRKELESLLVKNVDDSLTALNTTYIDVLMLHQGDEIILESRDVADIFMGLKNSGRVRAVGVSTYTTRQTKLAIESDQWDVLQIPFNMMDQRHAALFDAASAAEIGLVVRSVLLKGLLSEKGRNLHPALAEVEQYIHQFRSIASKAQLDIATLATKFALHFTQVSSILVGIDKQQYLEESIHAANGKQLNKELIRQIEASAYPDPDFLDLPKWDREGWLR